MKLILALINQILIIQSCMWNRDHCHKPYRRTLANLMAKSNLDSYELILGKLLDLHLVRQTPYRCFTANDRNDKKGVILIFSTLHSAFLA